MLVLHPHWQLMTSSLVLALHPHWQLMTSILMLALHPHWPSSCGARQEHSASASHFAPTLVNAALTNTA